MRIKSLLVSLLLIAAVPDVRAQSCLFNFPALSVCSDSNCSILIDVRPGGIARVLRDNRYGTQLGINFGEASVFDLGTNGRLNFGNGGGTQATRTEPSGTLTCQPFVPGLLPYTVDMSFGGWLRFSGNNRFELKDSSVFVLGSGSKIDGRLDIQSDGTISIASTGEMAMPNVDLDAAKGIALSSQGDIQIGYLQNQGTPADNQGINIAADGAVTIDTVDSNDDFSVTAGGNISIGEIQNADSISLTITPPDAGVIKIGLQQTTDNPVMCAPTDNCNGFQLDGSGGSVTCEPVNADGSVNDCGGGAMGLEWILLCLMALFRGCRMRVRRS